MRALPPGVAVRARARVRVRERAAVPRPVVLPMPVPTRRPAVPVPRQLARGLGLRRGIRVLVVLGPRRIARVRAQPVVVTLAVAMAFGPRRMSPPRWRIA